MKKIKIIDCHCHIGISIDGAGITYAEFKDILNKYPVDRVVVFPIDEQDKELTYERLNEGIAELAKQDMRIIPFGRVDPHSGDAAIAELDRFESLGLCGLKLHPFSEEFTPEIAAPVFKKAGELKLPIMLHSSQRSYREELEGWKKVFGLTGSPIIAAHAGKDNYRRLVKIMPSFPHLFADTTAVSYFRTRYVYDAVGPDRIVYGSDMPYSHPAIERLKYDLILKTEDHEKVFYQNAKKILNL